MQIKLENQHGEYKETIKREAIVEFNQKYQKYAQRDLTYQDIASLINLAKNDNKNQEFPTTIKIYVGGVDLASSSNVVDWLNNNINSDDKYFCQEVRINPDSTLVDEIRIIKKTE